MLYTFYMDNLNVMNSKLRSQTLFFWVQLRPKHQINIASDRPQTDYISPQKRCSRHKYGETQKKQKHLKVMKS